MKFFEEFGEVKVREEIPVPKSDLEKVLDIEEEIIREYERDERFEQHSKEEHIGWQLICTTLQEKLADIKINPELLQGYINARENSEENTQARIRGMYSAALLEIIATKIPETHTLIDGKGKTFNYLFYHIHNIKNLAIRNIKGNHILGMAGAFNGSVKILTLQNITGNNTLAYAGWNGNVTHITLQNIRGDNTLYCAGNYHGSATHITLTNITGDCTLYYAGSYRGSAKNIILQHITGNHTLQLASSNGSAINITLHNIKGHNTLNHAGENHGSVTNILQENELTKKQKSILSQIETMVENMHTLSSEEQKAAYDKIAQLQEEIFAGET